MRMKKRPIAAAAAAIIFILCFSFSAECKTGFTGTDYLKLDNERRLKLVTCFIEAGVEEGVTISKSPSFYKEKLDSFYAANKGLENEQLGKILTTLIIMEYDWTKKGVDKEKLAKEWLGEEVYKANKARLGKPEQASQKSLQMSFSPENIGTFCDLVMDMYKKGDFPAIYESMSKDSKASKSSGEWLDECGNIKKTYGKLKKYTRTGPYPGEVGTGIIECEYLAEFSKYDGAVIMSVIEENGELRVKSLVVVSNIAQIKGEGV